MSKTRFASFAVSCVVALTLAPSCTRAEAIEDIPTGTEVTVVTQDGTLVRGKIAKVDPELVTLTGERPNTTTEVTRTAITEVKRVDPKEAAERDCRAPGAGACRGGAHADDSRQHRARRHARHLAFVGG